MTLRLTPAHILACREAGVPLPLEKCETDGFSIFDWRHPKEGELLSPETPISFRWRFENGRLVAFVAYGWHPREIGYGRTANEPTWGYSILSNQERDVAVRRELSVEMAT